MKPIQILALGALACGAPDGSDADLYRSTTRTYPDGGVTSDVEPAPEIGRMQHALQVNGFFGWRAGTEGLKRGSRCTFGPDPMQTCYVPIRKLVRYYVDPAGFSAPDLQVIQNQQAFIRTYFMDLLALNELGWTVEPGAANDYNAKVVAGPVDGVAFPVTDSRHWSQLGCESSSTLAEPIALDGSWQGCSRIRVTLDVSKLLDDGAAANTRSPRIKQTSTQAIQWAMGLGLGNAFPNTTFQIAASTSGGLVPSFENSQLCALHRFNATVKTEVRKDALSACDGWEWPE